MFTVALGGLHTLTYAFGTCIVYTNRTARRRKGHRIFPKRGEKKEPSTIIFDSLLNNKHTIPWLQLNLPRSPDDGKYNYDICVVLRLLLMSFPLLHTYKLWTVKKGPLRILLLGAAPNYFSFSLFFNARPRSFYRFCNYETEWKRRKKIEKIVKRETKQTKKKKRAGHWNWWWQKENGR